MGIVDWALKSWDRVIERVDLVESRIGILDRDHCYMSGLMFMGLIIGYICS